jgi:carboxyl-terminal processing protease
MTFKKLSAFTLAGATVLMAANCPKPSPVEKEAVLMQALLNGLTSLHFNPQKINDDFSKKVYKLYLDRLDGGRRFLTQPDVNQLVGYETKIDDAVNAGDFEFFNKSIQLLDGGIAKAEVYYKAGLAQNFDFTKTESIELDGDKKPYAKDDAEMKDMWRKMMKYEVMTRLSNKLEDKEKGKVDLKDKSEAALREDAVKEATKYYTDYFKRIRKLKRTERLSTYLNAFANVYDPHTEYFEPIEKQNFDITMSGRLIGIGARLQTDPDGDFTKVTEVMTGGPAWKQKELHDGDLIMKVAQGDKDPVDVAGMEINDVVQMIRGKLGTEVRLTVKRKADGTVKVIPIVREEVIVDEGYAKSLIIKSDDKSDRIGYIWLPRFYADFDKADGHQCSEDVAKEVEKLKKENIKGIVLDLRNNGGGSLRDVVTMSGLFVEKGPIVQVKDKDARPQILPDEDETVQYDGPLVIMVNEFSASASEIMAAAMQDYGRAVIVGSNTYGKGTVQRFFDLDRAMRGNDAFKPLGQVKVTIQKFFRVNGGSTQLKGVRPDILLPDSYSEIKVGEQENEHPMPWTQIQPVPYSQSVVDMKKVSKLADASATRVKNNETFKLISENALRIKNQKERSTYSLNLKDFRSTEQKSRENSKKYEEAFKKNVAGLVIENLPVDAAAMAKDSSKIVRNNEWLKDRKRDVHLAETLNIMKDLIQNATFKTASKD